MTAPTKKVKRKRRRPRWGSVVPLPQARVLADQDRPRMCVLLPSGPRVLDDLTEVAPQDLRPVRRFRSTWKSRHAPQRPYIATMTRHIEVESLTESVHAQLLDRDPTVSLLVPQPFWIERHACERPGWAAPDFLVVYQDDRRAIVETKSARRSLAQSTVEKLSQVQAACARQGLPYQVHTALDVRQHQIFDLLQTYRSRRVLQGPGIPDLIGTVVEAATDPVPLEEVWKLGPTLQIRPLVWWLLWHNHLCLDWTQVVTSATVVRAHHPAKCATAGGLGPLDFICGPRVHDRLPDLLTADER